MENLIELNILERCHNCPEFEADTVKSIYYADTEKCRVDIQIICKNRGLCDRILEYLEENTQGD